MPRYKTEPSVSDTSCKQISSTSYSKLKGGDKGYQEAIEAARSFNKRLIRDRKMRIPFIDSQTRVAQANSMLWLAEYQRREVDDFDESEIDKKNNYVYYYPNKKWYKQRRLNIDPMDTHLFPHAVYRMPQHFDDNSNSMESNALMQNQSNNFLHQNLMKQSSISNDYDEESSNHHAHTNGHQMSHHYEDGYDNYDDPENESDPDNDYEDKGKKKGRRGGKRKTKEINGYKEDRSFECDRCGARYKTKPGLVYHIQKAHMKKSSNGHGNSHNHTPKTEAIPHDESTTNSVFESGVDDMNSSSSVPQTNGHKNGHTNRCGICNSSENENRMHQAEKFVACHECQKSFHPTCLNFSSTMLSSIKKYSWQCIECKKCTHCGNSENDDKLLFCDECDRGFHMYCLKPPLQEAPDGDWKCELCSK